MLLTQKPVGSCRQQVFGFYNAWIMISFSSCFDAVKSRVFAAIYLHPFVNE